MLLLQVLTSPRTAFEKLREKGKGGWVLALIIITLLGAGVVYLQLPLIEKMLIEQLESTPQEFPEDQLGIMVNITKITSIISAVLWPVINMFLVGLLLYLLNLIVRGEGGYMQLSKVALYASVPTIVGSLLSCVLLLTGGAQSLYDVSLTGGAFFEEKSGYAFGFATAFLDPFGIWDVTILTIGAAVMMRRPVGKVAPWIVGAWVLVRLGTAISTGMQATMM